MSEKFKNPIRNSEKNCRLNIMRYVVVTAPKRPTSGKRADAKEAGVYFCVCCAETLFDSDKILQWKRLAQLSAADRSA